MIEELFGGWGINWEVFQWIVAHLPQGSTILELGSGKSSAELNRYYKLYSVEHAEHYVNMYDTNYIFAPSPDNPKTLHSWYDVDILKSKMPVYDLLLIDGPDHSLRHNVLRHKDLFDWSRPIIIDDVQEGDLLIMGKHIADEICHRPYFVTETSGYKDNKHFMVIP